MDSNKIDKKCLVIFSGGQDSCTCLFHALNKYTEVEAITFWYGQNHSIENEQAKKICKLAGVNLHFVDISFFGSIVDSALTSGGDVNQKHSRLTKLPSSFVPNRNAMFITISHAKAQSIGAQILIGGMCETDFSGYNDCRRTFIDNLIYSLNIGTWGEEFDEDHFIKRGDDFISMETPLMWINKAETFKLADDLGCLDIILEHTNTCYKGDRTHRYAWGYGCDSCPACELRKKGYEEFLDKYKK